jgi:hypothetical protein
MDAQAFSLIEEMFERIDSNMPLKPTEQTEYARQLFGETGRSGGGIETIGEPDLFRTPIVDLGRWANDPWDQTIYGIDASTTRDFDYTNGLIMDTAYAKLGVGGSEADRAPEQAGTVKTVAYHDDSRSHIQNQTFSPRSVNGGRESDTGTIDLRAIRGEIVPYKADADSTQNLTKSISSVAQSLAEGEHAKRMLPEIDGPLFFDGSLYPLGVLYWVLLDHAGVTSPANRWDRPYEIVSNYLDVIDTLYERNLPVVGIVKTSTTSELTEALEAKIHRHEVADDDGIRPDVPWVRDHQFIADVLDNDNLDEFTYTSWFVSTELSAGRIDGEVLEPFADDLQHGEPSNYRRAFFYVRLPKQGFVLRVEAPLLFVRKDDERERIQTKALKEIAQRRDVPYSIKRADRIARITTENRETLLNTITTSSTRNYNDDGRWSDDDTSGLEPEDQ